MKTGSDLIRSLRDRWRVLYWTILGQSSPISQLTWDPPLEDLSPLEIYWPQDYQWPPASKWLQHFRAGLSSLVEVSECDIAQPFPGIAVLGLRCGDSTYLLAIDYSDNYEINHSCLNTCTVYFKLQYNPDLVSSPRVVPGGFVPGSPSIYNYLDSARQIADTKDIEVYGRFGSEFKPSLRQKVIDELRRDTRLDFTGGMSTVPFTQYLSEIARSRICIDLPGKGDFCFRLVDYFAVGACVISWGHSTEFPRSLKNGKHIAYADRSVSRLVDLCNYYLRDEEERAKMAQNSRKYFDQYLHKKQLAGYYINWTLRNSNAK